MSEKKIAGVHIENFNIYNREKMFIASTMSVIYENGQELRQAYKKKGLALGEGQMVPDYLGGGPAQLFPVIIPPDIRIGEIFVEDV